MSPQEKAEFHAKVMAEPAAPDRFDALLTLLAQQIAAINRLADSNQALVQAMAEGDGGMDDVAPSMYMNGSPIR